MSLAQIDQLRNEVKDAKLALENKEKELAEVRADKRVVKVTVPNMDLSRINIDASQLRVVFSCYANNYSKGIPGGGSYYIDEFGRTTTALANQIRGCLSVGSYISPNFKEHKEYVNLDDVKEEIRQELDRQYNNQIGTLREAEKGYIQSLAEVKKENEKSRDRLELSYNKSVDSLKEEITVWEQKYKDLQEDKDTRKREEQLEDIIKKLNAEIEKPWWVKKKKINFY